MGRTKEQAAAKANLRRRKTVSRYKRLGRLPSELRRPRIYRTRSDPFEAVWESVEAVLATRRRLKRWRCTSRCAGRSLKRTRRASYARFSGGSSSGAA
jgi:hypothetical protein